MKSMRILLLTDLVPLSHSVRRADTLEVAACCLAEPIMRGNDNLRINKEKINDLLL